MRLVFKPEQTAVTFERGSLRVSFSSLSSDDLSGWYRSNKGTRIPSDLWTKKVVNGIEKLVPDYENMTPEFLAKLSSDDDRLMSYHMTDLDGVELLDQEGNLLEFKDLSDSRKYEIIKVFRDELEGFEEFRSTYLAGAQKKYRAVDLSE